MNEVELIANTVALTNPVLARHPGAVQKAEFYASASRTDVQAALALNTNGRLRITSNNLNLNATSNFTINDSSLVYGAQLHASITPGANNAVQCEGWLFQAIQSVQVTFVGSSLPAMTIPGRIIREYILACCPSVDTRNNLIRTAGKLSGAATVSKASIPIGWALASGLGICKDFPIDMGFFKGPLQFAITFNSSNTFITGTGTGAAAPSNTALVNTFNELYLTCSTTDVKTLDLKLSNMYLRDQSLPYYIPGEYLSYANYVESCTIGALHTLNLNSAPDGMLEAIILLIKPLVELSASVGSAGTYVYPGSVGLSYLACNYGGEVLFEAHSDFEIKQYYRTHFAGDTKEYQFRYNGPNIAASGALSDPTYLVSRDPIYQAIMNSSCYMIPLCYDGAKSLSGNMTENLRSYGAKTLTIQFTPELRSRVSATSGFADISLADTVGGGAGAQNYSIDVLYIVSSVFGGQPNNPTLTYMVPGNNQ